MLDRFVIALALCALPTLGGCSVSAAMESDAGDDVGGSSATGGTGGTGGSVLSVSFAGGGPLTLQPSVTQELTVVVSPPVPSHVVRFALIDGDDNGSVEDASLDLTDAATDSNGVASVRLTAPSVPTHFDVRAIVGTVQATLDVQVGASGLETLAVKYFYGGERTVTEWIAEVYADGTICADLEGNPPEGSMPPFTSVTVPDGNPIQIPNVPVGEKLAVVLRAGHFIGGCSGVDAVVEGQANSVLVTVTNRPIQLDESDVTLQLGLDGQEDELSAGMETVIEAAQDAVLGAADSDSTALLDAMEEEATLSAVCARFATVRSANAWDVELETALGVDAATSIRDDLGRWLTAGVPSLARDDAFVGSLSALPDVADGASLVLTSVAGFPAGDAGFPETIASTWTADARDSVTLGATIDFNPAALLVLAASAPAKLAEPASSTVGDALALRGARCETVSSTLVARGQAVAQSCLGCDAACTRLLCERGIERLVSRASNALADEPAALRLAATGAAQVGDQAELETLDGSWVGALDAANRSSELGGNLVAE